MDSKQQSHLDDFRASLSRMDIAQLRQKASKNFGIKLTREHTKEDIIDAIMAYASKNNYADAAEGELKPGYARIKLLPSSGKPSGFPVYFNHNGYFCYIPINFEVDVPLKILETLKHAEEIRKVQNEFGEYVDSMELSYPFQVIATRDGPDPKPGIEVARERKQAPKRAFFKKYGYWPTDKVLQQAQAASVHFNMYADANNGDDSKDE